MTPSADQTRIERCLDALAGCFELLAHRYLTGTAAMGPGLLFLPLPDDPDVMPVVEETRFITRRNWTEFVLSTHDGVELSETVEAIEMVACVLGAVRAPLTLPVVLVSESRGPIEAALALLNRPAGCAVPALPSSN